MPISIQYYARLKWNKQPFNQILINLSQGLIEATQFYENAIRKELRKNVGSVITGASLQGRRGKLLQAILSGNVRRRVRHSRPGEAPYAQTFNLANSISSSYNFTTGSTTNKLVLRSRVSTPVRYARTLERGGALSVPISQKRFTSIRLINPLQTTPIIAPRPAWIPLFLQNESKMFNIIKKRGRLRVI